MVFRNDEGGIVESDKDDAKLTCKHFEGVLNKESNAYWSHVNDVLQKKIIECIGDPVSFGEFNIYLVKSYQHESPVVNGVTPIIFKSLNYYNKMALFELIKE